MCVYTYIHITMRGKYVIDDGLLTAGIMKHAKDGLPRMSYFVLGHKDIQ